jgi:hypothetical protein
VDVRLDRTGGHDAALAVDDLSRGTSPDVPDLGDATVAAADVREAAVGEPAPGEDEIELLLTRASTAPGGMVGARSGDIAWLARRKRSEREADAA